MIMSPHDQHQLRLAFGAFYSVEELLQLCEDRMVEDLVLQSLFLKSFQSLFIPAESHMCETIAKQLFSMGWSCAMFGARASLTVPHRLRALMDGFLFSSVDHVLGNFDRQELSILPQVVGAVAERLEYWASEDNMQKVIERVNTKAR